MLLALSSLLSLCEPAPRRVEVPMVHVVYFIPADRAYRPEYHAALEDAAAAVRGWFARELGGRTFDLAVPVVEVVHSPLPAEYHAADPLFPAGFPWAWWHSVADAAMCETGAAFAELDDVWLIYADAFPPCDIASGGAIGSVVVQNAHDLQVLAGFALDDPCPWEDADQTPALRQGVMAHELAHTLGIPHPPGCEDADASTPCPEDALMGAGFRRFPDSRLLDGEKLALSQTGYMYTPTPAAPEAMLAAALPPAVSPTPNLPPIIVPVPATPAPPTRLASGIAVGGLLTAGECRHFLLEVPAGTATLRLRLSGRNTPRLFAAAGGYASETSHDAAIGPEGTLVVATPTPGIWALALHGGDGESTYRLQAEVVEK